MKGAFLRRLGRHPWFFAAIASLGLAGVAGMADAGLQVGKRSRVAADLGRLRIEMLSPQARPEMVAAAEGELRELSARLAAARAAWPEASAPGSGEPEERLTVYAQLLGAIDGWRAAAADAGVAVGKDECFGFAGATTEAPAAGDSAELARAVGLVGAVLGELFASRPDRLNGVWIESAGDEASRGREARCRMDPLRSARVPGLVETRGLRFSFDGSTGSLRRLLNRLGRVAGLVVREVMVGTVAENQKKGDDAGRAGGSRFTVIVESVALAERLQPDQPPVAVAEPRAALWRDPAAGAGGPDLFGQGGLAYDAEMHRWRSAAAAPGVADEGVELVAVRRRPFRWRLVGWVGPQSDGGGAAVLEEAAGGRVVRLRIGETEPKTGVGLVGLEAVPGRDGAQLVRATLADPEETEPVRLTTRDGRASGRLSAVLRLAGRDGVVELAEGASVRVGEAEFLVTAIRGSPPEVELRRSEVGAAENGLLRLRTETGEE